MGWAGPHYLEFSSGHTMSPCFRVAWATKMRCRYSTFERAAFIRKRARTLAATGQFSDWRAIEAHLQIRDNLIEASEELDDPHFREELNASCHQAQQVRSKL
jgi:hypothetical protein